MMNKKTAKQNDVTKHFGNALLAHCVRLAIAFFIIQCAWRMPSEDIVTLLPRVLEATSSSIGMILGWSLFAGTNVIWIIVAILYMKTVGKFIRERNQ